MRAYVYLPTYDDKDKGKKKTEPGVQSLRGYGWKKAAIDFVLVVDVNNENGVGDGGEC